MMRWLLHHMIAVFERRYGYDAEADALEAQLLDHAEGLRDGAAIRENYHPLSGAGQHARHFSWSAAAILLMLWMPTANRLPSTLSR